MLFSHIFPLSSPCRFPNTPGGFRGAKRPVWNYLRWPASGVPLWGPPVRNHRRGAAVPQRDGSTARFARKWPKQLSVSGTSLFVRQCRVPPGWQTQPCLLRRGPFPQPSPLARMPCSAHPGAGWEPVSVTIIPDSAGEALPSPALHRQKS